MSKRTKINFETVKKLSKSIKINNNYITDLYTINPKLLKVLKQIIKKEIAYECRKDALYILQNCESKTIKEFLFFGLSENGNLACMCLDFAKDKKTGKYFKTKSFGLPILK